MSDIRKVGHNTATERDIYLLSVAEPDDIPELDLGCAHFGVLLMWDSNIDSQEQLRRVAEKLVALGGVYFCCWGAGCELMHDTIDEAAQEIDIPMGSVLMTTWHDDESLEETLWFFINTAFPHEAFELTTKSVVAISIRNSDWSDECFQAFQDPSAFTERVLENDEPAV